MACGAVPVATAQRGMAHFRHTLPTGHAEATGAALPRSFRAEDRMLVDEIKVQIRRLLGAPPEELARLRANAIRLARTFTWERVAANFHDIFVAVRNGRVRGHYREQLTQDRPPADGVASAQCGNWHIRYRCAQARTVDVVQGRRTWPLTARDGTFTGTVPASGEPTAVLLITLACGRVVWDELAVGEDLAVAGDAVDVVEEHDVRT